ncbi:hypothetical protein C8T65DRAFT_120856 [Cerioporus squamosus]|nr:hypothetical protein C8T65DRAFT_120856 [Cerioporus squamosus]
MSTTRRRISLVPTLLLCTDCPLARHTSPQATVRNSTIPSALGSVRRNDTVMVCCNAARPSPSSDSREVTPCAAMIPYGAYRTFPRRHIQQPCTPSDCLCNVWCEVACTTTNGRPSRLSHLYRVLSNVKLLNMRTRHLVARPWNDLRVPILFQPAIVEHSFTLMRYSAY